MLKQYKYQLIHNIITRGLTYVHTCPVNIYLVQFSLRKTACNQTQLAIQKLLIDNL